MTDEDDANYDGTLAGHGIESELKYQGKCELCKRTIYHTQRETKRCDRCWELETRIERDPDLARKILHRYDAWAAGE